MATLHTYFRSSAAYRVRIFFGIKRFVVPKKIHQSKAITANNQSISPNQPQGLVPAWEDDSGSYGQSFAIMLLLEDKHPTPALLPSDPAKKSRDFKCGAAHRLRYPSTQ